MPWYVIYTKPKSEIKTAQRLEKIGVDVFCPVKNEIRQWSDRKKKFTVPLFTSYLFVRLEEKDRAIVFEVPGVNNYLFWLGQPAIVRDNEIDIIKKWVNDDAIEDIQLMHLKAGDRLIIKKGAFKDREAVVQKIGKRKCKLILPTMGILLEAKLSEVCASENYRL
ncbi:UpxY family transcription antiterminator [Zunongwangia profunda]|uniref:UpxY family transcription antiterminator n=1 Tax=Zunongwangia profunda TaxID=398743 RepID=UPI001D1962AB|nr:UpxY family transcription antiterminator [Zunongwangia profunda]MCC4227335.1 UpxY family transcription antiterminator [Zunongwangia profunda]